MKSYKKTNISNNPRTEDGKETNDSCGNRDICEYKLSPERARIRATRPEGSLQAAIMKAKLCFPFCLIMTSFDDIPLEDNLDFEYLLINTSRPRCLLSFMYRYHENATRHGMYLKVRLMFRILEAAQFRKFFFDIIITSSIDFNYKVSFLLSDVTDWTLCSTFLIV